MRSGGSASFAVASQLVVSGTNYFVFVLLMLSLPQQAYLAFANAVGLSMLAFAFAEAGASYVAPREIHATTQRNPAGLAGAFVAFSATLYVLGLAVGYVLWSGFAKEPLQADWVIAYAMFFFPGILAPSWLLLRAVRLAATLYVVLIRSSVVALIYWFPTKEMLMFTGLLSLAGVLGLFRWLNREAAIISGFGIAELRAAILAIQRVFAVRTLSYVVYGALPLGIAVTVGNQAASQYVTGERLKSLVATLFQPLVQIGYLRKVAHEARGSSTALWTVFLLNIAVCLALLAFKHDIASALGPQLLSLDDLEAYILAAAASVGAATVLHLEVLPRGDVVSFGRAALMQTGVFIALLTTLAGSLPIAPGWILCAGEAVFLIALVAFATRVRRASR